MKNLISFIQPTNVVIVGSLKSEDEEDCIKVTDDYIAVNINVDGKKVQEFETDGRFQVILESDWEQWQKDYEYDLMGFEAIRIDSFVGDIEYGIYNEDDDAYIDINELDSEEYLFHELYDMNEDYYDYELCPVINLPYGTTFETILSDD